MAGRKAYIIAHPNGTDSITVVKGGKAPAFATWQFKNGAWEHIGYSYGTKDTAERSAKSSIGSRGYTWKVTRVLPAGL